MSDSENPVKIASVVLDNALDKCLDYSIPLEHASTLHPGMRVKVHVRKFLRDATVVEIKDTSAYGTLKPIAEVLSEKTFLSQELFALARWMSHYYCCPLSKVIKTILPSHIRQGIKPKEQFLITSKLSLPELLAYCEKERLKNTAQAAVLDVMLKHPKGVLLSRLIEAAQTSRSPISSLIKKKILVCDKMHIDRSHAADHDYFPTKPKNLNAEQKNALSQIEDRLKLASHHTMLIHGITGSGKTEIYLQAIDLALERGRGVIFLVPEIALTSQTLERLKGRFKEKIAILHHRLSPGERSDAWQHIHSGSTRIVVGARSALFSPVANLGLIIVDEEHEPSYKQAEEAPAYHARNTAIMRAKLCNALVLLGSATPSFESYFNALNGKYSLCTLKQRPDNAALPQIHSVDMRSEYAKSKGFALFSEPLLTAIKKRLELGEQTLLFLNRRGYHTVQMCPRCNYEFLCPHCDLRLTFHLGDNALACHLCDYRLSPPPRQCPKCALDGDFKFRGAGTELVERSLHAIFPAIRTLRLDADTTRHKGSHELLFKQFKAGKADVLIGTQMIAKGLHFPSATLVGILNADNALNIPDFRASEMAFQLLTQVAGRSGRGSLSGEVFIQTHMPEHPIITLAKAQDFEEFYKREIQTRALFCYPPYAHIVKVVLSSRNAALAKQEASSFREELIALLPPTYQLLPVIPCGYAKIKGQFRFQFLIKAEKLAALLSHFSVVISQKRFRRTRLFIDVDPLSTFF